VIAIVPHELKQLACNQRGQRDHAQEVEQEDQRLQAAELSRVLHTLCEQQ
jgi:hypothetical protein